MWIIGKATIHSYERGLLFRRNEFKALLAPGTHWFFDPLNRIRVDVVSMRAPWLSHPDLDLIIDSGALGDAAEVIDLKDNQRALVWIDGRFDRALGPGQHAVWKTLRKLRVEVVDARFALFTHQEAAVIAARAAGTRSDALLEMRFVPEGYVGVFYRDGAFVALLPPGPHLFWKGAGKVDMPLVDMRETVLDIAGQEIMTADKVTLRMNAVAVCRVKEARRFIETADDARQSLYREAQLAIRALVGALDLDALLAEKDRLAIDLTETLSARAEALGLTVVSAGIRDVILPGEMKALMNRVIEARKKADANLITRREETAAMRSQANTARILENNPTLMRLRELDVLEKISETTKLNVVLGDKGLVDRVVNVL